LSEQGEFAAALAHAEEGVRLGESVTSHDTLATACIGMGIAYLHKGDFGRAIPPLERVLGERTNASKHAQLRAARPVPP